MSTNKVTALLPAQKKAEEDWTLAQMSLGTETKPTPPPDMEEEFYYIRVRVTLTGQAPYGPPDSYAWTPEIVNNLLRIQDPDFTEALITGPGEAVVFYGRRTRGEGLTEAQAEISRARLSANVMWVAQSARLTADPVPVGDGRRIAQGAARAGIVDPPRKAGRPKLHGGWTGGSPHDLDQHRWDHLGTLGHGPKKARRKSTRHSIQCQAQEWQAA